MGKIDEIVFYLYNNFPHQHELSQARLVKMLYLADWKSVLQYGEPLTNIIWKTTNLGPHATNWNENILIPDNKNSAFDTLGKNDFTVLNFVISITSEKDWDEFNRLVNSTFPIFSSTLDKELNLIVLANEYKRYLPLLEKQPEQS